MAWWPACATGFGTVLRSRLELLLLITCLTACQRDQQVTCMSQALDQPGLKNGVIAWGIKSGSAHILHQSLVASMISHPSGRYRAASLTKPIMAGQIRKLVRNGALRLDAPLSTLLPPEIWGRSGGIPSITLERLMRHNAGFDSSLQDPIFIEGDVAGCETAMRIVLARIPEHPPGTVTTYSNAGYCILGRVLLDHEDKLDPEIKATLHAPLGAAGGWVSSIDQLYARLQTTLPLDDWGPEGVLPDGSYYASGWHYGGQARGPLWTHFGRLPGMLSVAATDGDDRLLVAYFDGDPPEPELAAQNFRETAWQCITDTSSDDATPTRTD